VEWVHVVIDMVQEEIAIIELRVWTEPTGLGPSPASTKFYGALVFGLNFSYFTSYFVNYLFEKILLIEIVCVDVGA